MKNTILGEIRQIWRMLPASLRAQPWRIAHRTIDIYSRIILTRASPSKPEAGGPLVVAGLFRSASGLGEAARSTYRSLKAAGLNPIAVDLSAHFTKIDLEPDIELSDMPRDRTGILIIQLNAPETIKALRLLNMRKGRQWYTIGYWAWELPTFPTGWEKVFDYLSEVWTISDFTAKSFRQSPKAPEIIIFHPSIVVPSVTSEDLLVFDIPNHVFVFLTMADSLSSLQRKNPFASIKAFRTAFGEDPSKLLLLKTRNLDMDAQGAADLAVSIGNAPNIKLVDVTLSECKLWQLIKTADCFVSLHRSEGFGLVLAEAMAIGTPVIATHWSGNTDFMTSENSVAIQAVLTPCKDHYDVYSRGDAVWADVDTDEVAKQMVRISEDATYRENLRQNALETISQKLNAKTIGTAMKARLAAK